MTLDAASITETGNNALIIANTLTTTSRGGSTSLGGSNDVTSFNGTSGGPLTLVDSGIYR